MMVRNSTSEKTTRDRPTAQLGGFLIRIRRWVILAVMGLLLACGWRAAEWRAQAKDSDMRAQLLQQAAAIARTIDPEQVRSLSFTEADKANPILLRLHEQMASYRPLAHCRGIYTIALRDRKTVFGPESYDESDPQASPPGTIYEQPTPQLREFFKTGLSFTEGPYADEYGTFVSAFTPVLDPRTGKVLMVVGLDIEASAWQATLNRERLIAGLCTLALAAILLGGVLVLRWRDRLPLDRQGWLRYAETYLIAAFGVALTFIAAMALRGDETRSRRNLFSQLAEIRADRVKEVFRNLRDNQVGALVRFYESSRQVGQDEFRLFAGPIVRQSGVQALEWIPSIPGPGKEAMEAQARTEGIGNFAIWQKGPGGQREPATGRDTYYPVWHVEPLAGNEAALGYDLGSEPVRRAALKKALATGLPVATDPITLVQEKGSQTGMLVFHPVFAGKGEAKALRGFALAVLRLESLLQTALASGKADDDTSSVVDLLQLTPGQAPRFLASSSRREAQRHASGRIGEEVAHLEHGDLSGAYPLFAFGKTFVLTIHPGLVFLADHPTRAGGASAFVGLLLTTVLTAFTAFLTRRRTDLEIQVRDRTSALRESEAKHRLILDHSSDLIWNLTPQGIFTYVSPSWKRATGYEPSAILGTSFQPIIHPEDVPTCLASLSRIIETKEVTHIEEYRVRHADGLWHWHTASGTPVLSSDGGVVSIVGVSHDITESKRTEDALRTSKAELDLALRSAQMGVWNWDLNENKRHFDEQVCRLLGIAPETFTGTAEEFLNAIHPDDREALKAALRRSAEQGVPYEPEYRAAWPDGSIRHIAAKGTVIHDENGRPVKLNGLILDVTERKRMEQSLLEQRNLLANVIEGTNVGTWRWHVQTGEAEFNERWAEIVGYTLDALAPISIQTWLGLAHPDDLKESEAMLQKHFAGSLDHYDFECRMRHKDGSWVWVHDRGKVTEWTKDGRPLVMTGTHSDITKRKQAEDALREETALLESQVNASLDGILVISENRRRLIVNQRIAELFDVPPHIMDDPDDTALLKHVVGLTRHPEAFLEKVEYLYNHIKEHSRDEIELKSGRVLDRYSAPVLSEDGKYYGRIWTFRDITERKQAEAALRETNRSLEETTAQARSLAQEAAKANAAKSEFLANMSHEIRTPMTAILGYTDLISEDCPKECAHGGRQLRESVAIIRRNGEHLLALINDVLDLSKIEAEKMTTEQVVCSPCQIVTEVASLVQTRATSKGLWFDIEFIGPIPESIRTDPLRLRQILANLLGNAIKFTEGGGVRLLIRLITENGEPRMQFDVIDTGIGMTREQTGRLFQAFGQADTSTTRQFGGTGLGLVISKRLAQLLGGDVTIVDTQPGLGTRFRVTVAVGPLDGVSMIEAGSIEGILSAQHKTAAETPTTATQAAPLAGLRILLAEDGPDNQRLFTHLLKKAGALVTLATNGREAVDQVMGGLCGRRETDPRHPFDLILMDMQMPEMDGYEATARLRAAEYHGPIIALTAHAMGQDRQKCLDAGCNDYASKPIDMSKLIETIRRQIQHPSPV